MSVRDLMRVLETPAFTLEPQVEAHAEEMFAVLADPAIYEYENEPPRSLEWLRERYKRLESRRSADGSQRWLNWVIRLPSSELIGYVQATVFDDGHAAIAYELNSRHWRRGFGKRAVQAMLEELRDQYRVHRFTAVLKRVNFRSLALLRSAGFDEVLHAGGEVEPDEILMQKRAVES